MASSCLKCRMGESKMGRFSIFASSPYDYPKVQFRCSSYELVDNIFAFFPDLQWISFTPLKSDFLLYAHFFVILKCQINFDAHPSIII